MNAGGSGVKKGTAAVGVIGAGAFARGVLLPALARTDARIAHVADLDGATARHAGKKFGAEQATTDYRRLLDDPEVDAVFIATGHNTHARFVSEAIEAGKHVFVEKPLCLTEAELQAIEDLVHAKEGAERRLLMVGFNRRFSAHTVKMKQLLAGRTEPLTMSMTVNAGEIPPDHWIQDPKRGGGRIIGEACHFIDLLAHLTNSPVRTVSAMMVGAGPPVRDDKMAIVLGFADGSVGTVNYFANGSKSYPKEMLEVFSQGRVLRLENFRRTRGYGFRGFKRLKTARQEKGHGTELDAFVRTVECGGEPLIPFSELKNITQASFAAVKSARERICIRV